MTEQQITEVVPVETAETPVVLAGDTAKPEGAEVKPVVEKTFTQAEVNELVQQRLARDRAKRERELEADVRRLKEQTAPPPQQASDPAAPKREDFEDYERYIEAKAEHTARNTFKAEREREQRASQEAKATEDRNTAMREFHKRETVAREKYADLDDLLSSPPPVTSHTFDALMELDEGWDVTYYLWKNPEEAHRISQLSPTRQAAEVGKLAAKVASAPAPKPASVSRAPAPIEPLGGGVTAVSDKPPENPDDFLRWHNERERAKRKRT